MPDVNELTSGFSGARVVDAMGVDDD